MTQEEKELLIKDLSSRLAYRVKFPIYWWNEETQTDEEIVATLYSINADGYCEIFDHDGTVYIDNIKPYLRPMSSMTEKERNELRQLMNCDAVTDCSLEYAVGGCVDYDDFLVYYEDSSKLTDWLNEKMFDYRGLIKKGLALEAPEGMYDS